MEDWQRRTSGNRMGTGASVGKSQCGDLSVKTPWGPSHSGIHNPGRFPPEAQTCFHSKYETRTPCSFCRARRNETILKYPNILMPWRDWGQE